MKLLNRYFSSGLLALSILIAACSKTEIGNRERICGRNYKTWKEVVETDSSGKEKNMNDVQRQSVLQFYENGNFSITTPTQAVGGTWMFNRESKKLSLDMIEGGTKNFTVEELTRRKMRLKSPDGSQLILEVE